jgi:NhaP-type Na+/H+ or K+/H+ antiporter
MTEHILFAFALVIFLGVIGQWLAWRIKLPSIIFLLFIGALAGPITGLLNPDKLLGDLLFPLVSMGVAIILFEGGLTLRIHKVQGLTTTLYSLLTIGILLTWGIVSVSTHLLIGLSWELAILFGALMTVTGPTVIKPLLEAVRPSADIANILHWEGVILDVIGAILIVLVFQFIISEQAGEDIPLVFASVIATGLVGGAVGAYILAFLLRHFLIPHYLHHVFSLGLVLLIFAVSNMIAHESGLLAVTLMGMMLANMKDVDTEEILLFKEKLSLLFISVLFILLSARLDFAALFGMGWSALILLAIIIFVARPISVFFSTLFSPLSWNARILLSWIAPRGIIAASVSALFALRLESLGYLDAELLVPLTFMVIISTILLYGTTAKPLALWLNEREPDPKGMLIVGANTFAREIAKSLNKQGFSAKVTDTNRKNIHKARMDGLDIFYGHIISDHAFKHMDLAGIGGLLAVSTNTTLNALACEHFKADFGPKNIYYLLNSDEKNLEKSKTIHPAAGGRQLFSENMTHAKLLSLVNNGAKITTTQLSEKYDLSQYLKHKENKKIPLYAVDSNEQLHFFTSDHELTPKAGWSITSLVYS